MLTQDIRPSDALHLDRLCFAFASQTSVVSEFTLALEAGSLFTLLGPSGCGKTTLLRLLGGYLQPSLGRITLEGRDITSLPPERRDIGMVFQNYALFPHLSAFDNIAFGLQMRGIARGDRRRRVAAMLERVGLSAAEGKRYPRALSGGQQQRVALARALVIEPKLLLLDEPMANLDKPLREQLRAEFRDLQRRTGVTTLLVTHDQEEALALSDRVGLMRAGRLLQVGPPEEIYRRPRCPFVARFLGAANLFEIAAKEDRKLSLKNGLSLRLFLEETIPDGAGGRWLLLRPEALTLTPSTRSWPAHVVGSSFLGPDRMMSLALEGGVSLQLRMRGEAVPLGSMVQVGIPEGAFWIIPEDDPVAITVAANGAS